MLDFPVFETPGLATGEMTQIAPGVYWLRMPAPGQLAAINVWAISGTNGWTIVDTGMRSTATADGWRAAFSNGLSNQPLDRVCVTHMHPDHSGMAGWLTKHHGVSLWMSRLEYFMLYTLTGYTGQEAPQSALDFYRSTGWDAEDIDFYLARFGEFGQMVYPLPSAFCAMHDGDILDTGESQWRVITGRGHSPEQALLYNESQGLLISGDQVLPKISSNVSVYPQEPTADPLTEWLESLDEVRQRVPDDVLVLPSHGQPFRGLHERIAALIEGHETGLGRLFDLLEEPRRAIDCFPALFKREISRGVLVMATGESLAHLACLRTRGLASSRLDEQKQEWWSRV